MSQDNAAALSVKPRVAAGRIRRAQGVEVPVYLAGGTVLVRVSKAALLEALRRARGCRVEVAEPFGDGRLIVG